jgi:charged multivesicular body protein 1
MENQLFNLKFAAKQLIRQSKKSEKNEKAQKLKLKQSIEKGNMDGARIYAQNAIREKNQALNYLRLSSRIDAVASRVETAIRMRTVTGSMANIVRGMDAALASMDMQRITTVMDKFEQQFEDLDVQANYVENSMNSTTALTTPPDEVDSLISQVADEHGLEIAGKMGAGSVPAGKPGAKEKEHDELEERLNRLKAV